MFLDKLSVIKIGIYIIVNGRQIDWLLIEVAKIKIESSWTPSTLDVTFIWAHDSPI